MRSSSALKWSFQTCTMLREGVATDRLRKSSLDLKSLNHSKTPNDKPEGVGLFLCVVAVKLKL